MLQIEGLTQAEVVEIVEKIARTHNHKTFGFYTKADIHQEIWIIVLEKLPEFQMSRGTTKDVGKSLEHWLNSVVSKRLLNLKRDRYLVPQGYKFDNPNRCGTAHMPHGLDDNYDNVPPSKLGLNEFEYEVIEFLVQNLTAFEVKILESVINGEKISQYYKNKLSKSVKTLLRQYGIKK